MSEIVERKLNIPELRFPQFDGKWEEKCLDEIGGFKNGHNADKNSYGHGIPFVNLMDVFGHQFLPSKEFGLVNASEKEKKEYALKYGDILFVRSSVKREGVGLACLVGNDIDNVIYSGFLIRFRTIYKNLLNEFKPYCLNSPAIRKQILSKASTSANTNINQAALASILVAIPSLPEQQKIASFLSAVDEKIAQLQEKKTLLEDYKKGCMQKLFSQTLRFKDDNGNDYPDWDCLSAGKLFQNISNKKHSGELPILAITQDMGAIFRDNLDKDIYSSEASVQSYKVIEPGDFIISLRSFQGGLEYSKILGICSPAYTILRATKPICDGFFKNYFKKEDFISRLSATVVGIREGKQISYGAFSTLTLPFPHIDEQQKIANFLSAIDNKITHATTQLEQTKTFKKGLLQKMFV